MPAIFSLFQVLANFCRNKQFSRQSSVDWGMEPNAYSAAIKQANIAIIRTILQSGHDSTDLDRTLVHVLKAIHQSIIDVIDTLDKHPKRTRQLLAILREVLRFWCDDRVPEVTIPEVEYRPALINSVMMCSTHDPKRLGAMYTLLKAGDASIFFCLRCFLTVLSGCLSVDDPHPLCKFSAKI